VVLTELQGLKNVILTPHIGGSTEEAQRNIADFVPSKIMEYINAGSTVDAVNFPNIRLPKQNNAHRFLHIHKNVPGIMAKILSNKCTVDVVKKTSSTVLIGLYCFIYDDRVHFLE